MIRKELIHEEYYLSADTCSECTMKLKKNTPKEYARKAADMRALRKKLGEEPFREGSFREIGQKEQLDYEKLLGHDGRFADLADDVPGAQTAIQRLALIGADYHKSQNRIWPAEWKERVLRGAAHYCRIEADRKDLGGSRFHSSIFMFPSCALNLFFDLQEDMEKFEAYEEGNREVSFDTSVELVEDAFWSEGICADGFGWGHGRQSYITGYAYDGSINALKMLNLLKGTAWDDGEKLDFRWLFNYIHGLSFNTYQGEWVPMQTRYAFKHTHVHTPGAEKCIRDLAGALKKVFESHMTPEQKEEVNQILRTKIVDEMSGEEYQGIRYFFNNDALIVKHPEQYLYVNMASARTDGVEFADCMADKRNYFMGDGSYMLMRKGDEYDVARGTWQVSHIPGVTERDLKNGELKTETNWTGYHSKYNFAAGVCSQKTVYADFCSRRIPEDRQMEAV